MKLFGSFFKRKGEDAPAPPSPFPCIDDATTRLLALNRSLADITLPHRRHVAAAYLTSLVECLDGIVASVRATDRMTMEPHRRQLEHLATRLPQAIGGQLEGQLAEELKYLLTLVAVGTELSNLAYSFGGTPAEKARAVAQIEAASRQIKEVAASLESSKCPCAEEWPRTVDEAASRVLAKVAETHKQELIRLRLPKDKFVAPHHEAWGRQIRNDFGLWEGNEALMTACRAAHPDDASRAIIEAIWEKLYHNS